MDGTNKAEVTKADAPLLDSRGRPRSKATFAEYHIGRAPGNKGRKLPAEVLTRDEFDAVLNAASPKGPDFEARDKAIVWLMYRTGVKVGQLVALERRHYEPGADEITVPGYGHRFRPAPEAPRPLDAIGRELLTEWIEVRRRRRVGRTAPLFCTMLSTDKGRPLDKGAVRAMLAARAERAGVDRRVTPEGLRATGVAHGQGRGASASYVDEVAFQARYPLPYRRWRDAHDLYAINADRHASSIGVACRDAMIAFGSELAARYDVEVDAQRRQYISHVAAVLEARSSDSEALRTFYRALLDYFGAVSGLVQRQVHAQEREGTPLTGEDARRVVFQTILVMHEIDRALDTSY